MEIGKPVPSAQHLYYDDELNLVEVFHKLCKHKISIIIIFLVMTVSAYVLSIKSPRMYKTSATLLINTSEERGSGNAQSRTTGTTYVPQNIHVLKAILESRSMRAQAVKKGNLLPVFFGNLWDKKKNDWKPGLKYVPTFNDGADVLGRMLSIQQKGDDPRLTIVATHHDPAFAARAANLYVDTLEEVLKTNTFSLVKKNRLFLEQQLSEVKKNIAQSKKKLEDLKQRHNIYDLELQSNASLQAYSKQSKQLAEYESELRNLLKITTHKNPQVAQLNSKIETIRPFLQQLRGDSENEKSEFKEDFIFAAGHKLGDRYIPLKLLSKLRIQYSTLEKERAHQLQIYDLLADAYEKAKIQESKEDIYFTVLDKAITPKGPFKPNTRKDVKIAALAGLLIGIFQAFFQDYISTARQRLKNSDKRQAVIPTNDFERPLVDGDLGNQSTSKGNKHNV